MKRGVGDVSSGDGGQCVFMHREVLASRQVIHYEERNGDKFSDELQTVTDSADSTIQTCRAVRE